MTRYRGGEVTRAREEKLRFRVRFNDGVYREVYNLSWVVENVVSPASGLCKQPENSARCALAGIQPPRGHRQLAPTSLGLPASLSVRPSPRCSAQRTQLSGTRLPVPQLNTSKEVLGAVAGRQSAAHFPQGADCFSLFGDSMRQAYPCTPGWVQTGDL